ncbi:hypothetical protein OSTOST_00735 [Ostertagia ostertagi]
MFPLKYLKQRTPYALTVIIEERFFKEPITCSLNNAVTASNFTMLRVIRVVATLSCVLVYIPIFARMYKNITAHYEMTNQSTGNQKKLLRMTLTISLITSNTILFFTIPDIIMILHPDYDSNLFFILNLNKVFSRNISYRTALLRGTCRGQMNTGCCVRKRMKLWWAS